MPVPAPVVAAVSSPAAAPAGPAYLELIINRDAREFWQSFVADMRAPTSAVTGAFDAWLLREGITVGERQTIVPMAARQLDADADGFVTYADFNTFTLGPVHHCLQ